MSENRSMGVIKIKIKENIWYVKGIIINEIMEISEQYTLKE